MVRGRPPRMACKEACASAAKRGRVLDAAGITGSHVDLILFVLGQIIFIRVKRSHSRIIAVGELVVRFSSEIAELRKVPLTPVVSRELWIFLPWEAWQCFAIGDESITEILGDAGQIPGVDGESDRKKGPGNPVPLRE